jgi:5-oxoprolinase (ATP-hydrolysing)
MNLHPWQFWIDRGGTFTDIVARAPDNTLRTAKFLSENPAQYEDAALHGIRHFLGLGRQDPIPAATIAAVKMGTTVATNALLERKGARTLLLINTGFADLLRIGTQARPRLFELDIKLPEMLYQQVAEVTCRTAIDGTELAPLDEPAALATLRAARANGLESVAIALIHAWKYPEQEQRLAELARQAGFAQVTCSHAASPLLRLVPRADTAVADAYLTPILHRYVARVTAGLGDAPLYFMQSHGGLTTAAHFSGKNAILSGPAGGITGAVRTAAAAAITRIIAFDMGGTSTDVALYDNAYQRSFETQIAGIRLRTPQLAINTVAAGGGSIVAFDGDRLRAGPHSAGAFPGPAAYRNGGPLTITDANIAVGKVLPAHFPAIFGPSGTAPLDTATVAAKFSALATEMGTTPEAAAAGAIAIAVANMAHAIRQISVQRGHNPADFTLVCFGGAGAQHACLVAEELGMTEIFIHPYAGVLSAYGIGLADFSQIATQSVEIAFTPDAFPFLQATASTLAQTATATLRTQTESPITTSATIALRITGTDTAIPIPLTANFEDMAENFHTAHHRLFGFSTPTKQLTAESITIDATAPGETLNEPTLPARFFPKPLGTTRIFTANAWHETAIYDRDALGAGARIPGPAILREANATTIIEPGWTAEISAQNHCHLRRQDSVMPAQAGIHDFATPSPILLELFANLFMAVAEQAGTVLQNTAQSVNIKERLDFSCALFDATGALIANAPHVPVHLGAMGASVRHVIAKRGKTLRPGDAVALNNPYEGGTHLPDITLITPVFDDAEKDIIFFTACRAHHADVGGLTPGSTPPFSRTLEDEGVIIDDFLIMDAGTFQESAFRHLLTSAKHPARNPSQNLADMSAQIAANATAAAALRAIIARYTLPVVQAYTAHVMANAESALRTVISNLKDGAYAYTMDDGAALHVAITIDHETKSATIDFTGTGKAAENNFNAPPAVTTAAVLYAFRCLIGTDLPLNEGCLKPLNIIIPPGSFLNPPPGHAVVAGNTEVSQAVTSAIFGALGAAAASQSTMNNFLFGNEKYQYYETICGGAGATARAPGACAVHTHMTNTRMTDPEVMELRYPVRIKEFSIRKNSGGAGKHAGGNGVTRKVEFLEPMTATIVASRRVTGPFGLAGGAAGAPGAQWIEHPDGTRTNLPGCAASELQAGQTFVIATPGGGGHGAPNDP